MNFFLNSTTNSKWHQLWKFVLFTGLRAGEVAALKWDCIHLAMKSGNHVGYIKVKRSCAQKTKFISERTKNGDRRIVSEIMGHRDLNTTNRYSHVSNQTLGSEVTKWFEKQNQQHSNNVDLVAL